VMDINNNGRPNTLNKDVVLFNANRLGKCPIELPSGVCFGTAFSPSCLSDTSASYSNSLGIKYKFYYASTVCDRWGGAVEAAGGTSNMPTLSQLHELNELLYSSGSFDSEKAVSMGLPSSYDFHIWSNKEYNKYSSYALHFSHPGVENSLYRADFAREAYALPQCECD
ncbi:MAG: hypothetical protein LUE64_02845, partial [Candidatus Gastranaerophilales bacterium]|nr:hypothetical protein [Candidatus Gastranaerophilales bacterium]